MTRKPPIIEQDTPVTVTRQDYRVGVAPCGATYGTAAGPNDGVTRCQCGKVHPVEVALIVLSVRVDGTP